MVCSSGGGASRARAELGRKENKRRRWEGCGAGLCGGEGGACSELRLGVRVKSLGARWIPSGRRGKEEDDGRAVLVSGRNEKEKGGGRDEPVWAGRKKMKKGERGWAGVEKREKDKSGRRPKVRRKIKKERMRG